MLLLRCLAASVVAVLSFAGTASAATHTDIAYAVHFEGTGKYHKLDHFEYGAGYVSEDEYDVQFSFSGDINEGVVFRDGHPFDTSGKDLPTATVTGNLVTRGMGGGSTCPVDEPQPSRGWMRITEPELTPLDGETHIYLRPFEQFEASFDCLDSFPDVSLYDFSELDEEGIVPVGKHTFDTEFTLPQEVFGMGYIEQLLPVKVVEGERCPGRQYETTECRIEWSGKVTLRKLWENRFTSDGAPAPPSTAPGDDPTDRLVPLVPAPQPPSSSDDDVELAPLVEQNSAKLSPGARSASVTVTCASGCSGTLAVLPAVGRARAAGAKTPQVLARKRFTVRAGRPKTISVKLGSKARRAAIRKGRVTLRLNFVKPARTTRTVTAHAARP
jgi:hypothetical protein